MCHSSYFREHGKQGFMKICDMPREVEVVGLGALKMRLATADLHTVISN